MLKNFSYFLIILLVEGAALMAVELMGAKLIAPFFGSSLYVWTAALGFTVTGLSLGYYFGGRMSVNKVSAKKLFIVLGISALLVFALPYTTALLISLTSGLSLIAGISVTCMFLLLPPMLCFGMVGPIVVKLLAVKLQNNGSVAGLVYFVSTSGGIAATFLFGFYLIPVAGLKTSALITGLALASLLIIYLTQPHAAPPAESLSMPARPQPADNKATPAKTPAANTALSYRSIYLFAALEGAAVMAVELLAARMLAPWFGTSLYVWSAVMAFTLVGLAIGYFFGGRLPARFPMPAALWWVLLAAGSFILLMHVTAGQLTVAFNALSIKTAVLVVGCLLILPPLALLGTVPALLIRYAAATIADVGAVTGKIFTISSVSGIISLFIMGFFIIPQFGLSGPAIFLGFAVGIAPFIKLVAQKKFASLLFIAVLLASLSAKKVDTANDDIEIKYYSEGLLGQILVADVNKYDTSVTSDRLLLVNRIGEAQINRTTGATKWDYPYYIASLASKLPEKSNALMLGLGGGQIPNILYKMNFNVDVVELDQRIVDVAHDYFYLNNNVDVTVDDARHYLETTTKKYDVIIIDVFHGDVAPPHMLSLQSFQKAASLLNKNGLILVNFFGFLHGDLGKPERSLYNTMVAAGLRTKIMPTTGKEEDRNAMFIGSKEDQGFATVRSPLSLYGKIVNMDTMFADVQKLDMKDAVIFTDDKPSLDVLNINGVIDFRNSYTNIIKQFLKEGIPLYR